MRFRDLYLIVFLLISGHSAWGNRSEPNYGFSPTIKSVSIENRRFLKVEYQIGRTVFEEKIRFPREIAEYRYCPWLNATGIAVVARVGDEESAEYYYGAIRLSLNFYSFEAHRAVKLLTPALIYPVLGIGNPGGDTIVITAMQNRRGEIETLSGWVYVNRCPYPEFSEGMAEPVLLMREARLE